MKQTTLMLVAFNLMACSHHNTQPNAMTEQPVNIAKSIYYDGNSDDLLTAGLGLSGLRGAAPELGDSPTAKTLRQVSYYHQFNALNDLSEGGGFGDLYGFDRQQPAIAGFEYWSQRKIAPKVYHAVVVQVPDDLNTENACLVVAPSSGSRNVLGAVGTTGPWALKHGCAVVYSDKGTGTQVALNDDRSYLIDGLLTSEKDINTNPMMSRDVLTSPSAFHVVQRHPYSQVNPEQYWGEFVLDATAFGLAVLKQKNNLTRQQIKVIAASVSNGGGAVLRAVEGDENGLIDAVVAAEPQINLTHQFNVLHNQQQTSVVTLSLLELSMNLSLFEPCAALDKSLNNSPFKLNTVLLQPNMRARCQRLKDALLLTGKDTNALAKNALKQIENLKITEAALQLVQLNTLANMWGSINHTYSNSYLRKSAAQNLCQSAMSAFTVSGEPRQLSHAEITAMFAQSNGIAPSNGVELAHTNEDNKVLSKMIMASGLGIESQLCFYQLLTSNELQDAIETIQSDPTKNKVPTLILHGQADGTVAINHSSRAYFHQNQSHSMPNNNMRYYEIENIQHFDAFLAYPGFNQKFVPMHPYFEQALDLIYAHLFDDLVLPPSQLIKTTPRGLNGQQVPDLNRKNVPAIATQAKHKITVNQQQLEIE